MDKNYKRWGTLFDIAGLKVKLLAMEKESSAPNFWDDMDAAQKVLQEIKVLQDRIGKYYKLAEEYEDTTTLVEMALEDYDADIASEAKLEGKRFLTNYEKMRVSTLLDGEYDQNNAMLSIHSGAGGTEACDWAAMLLRMYTRWAENQGYKVEVLDYLPGDEAGVKSVTVKIDGDNAYGYLKSEMGIHRLVRMSPFDSSGRRHTSFASCDVIPQITDDVHVDIAMEDVRIDTYRATGAGGQHVNTTDSAVRMTHIPTGIVVQCQNERSQIQNRENAMQMLRAKLFKKEEEERMAKLDGIRGEKKEIGWGSQVRSYVFHPYTLVKDHRTNQEMGNVNAVMDGSIDIFMNAYLAWIHKTDE